MSLIRLYVDEDAMDEDVVKPFEHVASTQRPHRVAGCFSALTTSIYCMPPIMAASYTASTCPISVDQQRYTVGDQVKRLVRLISSKSAEEMKARIEFLSNWD